MIRMRYHMKADKKWLRENIRRYGAWWMFDGEAITVADALQMVDNIETQYVPLGECDRHGPDGTCLGHEIHDQDNEAAP